MWLSLGEILMNCVAWDVIEGSLLSCCHQATTEIHYPDKYEPEPVCFLHALRMFLQRKRKIQGLRFRRM